MVTKSPLFGLGFRPRHYDALLTAEQRDVQFLEIMTENYLHHGKAKSSFLDHVANTWPLALHGVSLSIGSSGRLNPEYLTLLRHLAQRLRPLYVTDHLCWTSFAGRNSHDLLPLPYTEKALQHVASRIAYVQDFLGQKIYLENPSAYVSFLASTLDEADFFAALVAKTGCGILLDINNLYVGYRNLGIDPQKYLDKIPLDSVAYIHMAGHTNLGDILVDTHDQPVSADVLDLYADATRRLPPVPTVLEWDGTVPEYETVVRELDILKLHHGSRTPTGHLRFTPKKPSENLRTSVEWGEALPATQERFFTLVTAPKAYMKSETQLSSILNPNLPVPAIRGLHVYREAYWERLTKVIRDTYPCLYTLLGRDLFARIIEDYLQVFPPTEPDIKYAGQHLANFLLQKGNIDQVKVPIQVLADIGQLEWTKYDAHDDFEPENQVTEVDLCAITPEAWPHVVVEFHPTIRVVKSDWQIGPIVDASARGESPDKPPQIRSAYLVRKKHHDVEVSNPPWREYDLFEKLREGLPFEEALTRSFARDLTELDVSQGVTWLSQWCSSGYVKRIWSSQNNLSS